MFEGGHIHTRTGKASTTAGTKNANHSRRRVNRNQNADNATTVPHACTWNAGISPATTPAKRYTCQPSSSRVAVHTSTSTIRARLNPNSVVRCGTR